MWIGMRRQTRLAALAAATVLPLAGTIVGCNGDTTTSGPSGLTALTPTARVPATLTIYGGDQVALAGAWFSSPVALVLDAAGQGVPGVTVTFTTSGGGSVQPTSKLTDRDGKASPNWISGAGENTLTASAPGVRSATITSHGIDSSTAALYELVDVKPRYGDGLAGTMFLAKGFFYTTVSCEAPATCGATGWGTYGVSGSSLQLDYRNQFLQYWDEFAENREFGTVRGDTLEVNQTDSMWPPYSFHLRFVFAGGTRP